MQAIIALVAGLLFGLGLTVSGMINPAKALGFLDVAGNWDPSLAFVMAGAIPLAAIGFALGNRRRAPVAATKFATPTKSGIDARLILGALTFGVGWGLVGFCPGPGIASLFPGGWRASVFVAAMLVGMAIFHSVETLARRNVSMRAP